jgi:TM2 domain-containing membrane protein YozV
VTAFTRATHKERKSPVAAMLWSIAFPGFGQIYNGEFVRGVLFMISETLINVLAKLNLSIYYSFHGEFEKAHETIDYQWGLFYPSLFCYSIWHAYNRARSINAQLDGQELRNNKLTGFFFGLMLGMNLGLYWHFDSLGSYYPAFKIIDVPVFSGLIHGLILASIAHLIETLVAHRSARKRRRGRNVS